MVVTPACTAEERIEGVADSCRGRSHCGSTGNPPYAQHEQVCQVNITGRQLLIEKKTIVPFCQQQTSLWQYVKITKKVTGINRMVRALY
jgi:hypothetical protein